MTVFSTCMKPSLSPRVSWLILRRFLTSTKAIYSSSAKSNPVAQHYIELGQMLEFNANLDTAKRLMPKPCCQIQAHSKLIKGFVELTAGWNWHSQGYPGICGYDFRFFTGVRYTLAKPSPYGQKKKKSTKNFKDIDNLSPTEESEKETPQAGAKLSSPIEGQNNTTPATPVSTDSLQPVPLH